MRFQILVGACLLSIIPAAGCGDTGMVEINTGFSCADPDEENHQNPCPKKDTDAGQGAGPASPSCDGECVAINEDPWVWPHLVWIGPPGQAPPCPEGAPMPGRRLFAWLSASPDICDPCACDPPAGSCVVPTKLRAHDGVCLGTWTEETSFDGPAGWNGACTSENGISANKECNGVDCVQSLIISPLEVVEGSSCTPRVVPMPRRDEPPSWALEAQFCLGFGEGWCENHVICAPSAPAGFRHCVSYLGITDDPCPDDYPEGLVFYDDFDDHRTCTDCACGSPSGSTCSATLSIWDNDSCAGAPSITHPFGSAGDLCLNFVPSGPALMSKTVSPPIYQPGACEPSVRQVKGAIEPTGPVTLCCTASAGDPLRYFSKN